MDACARCGARLGATAAWCGQCYAPVATDGAPLDQHSVAVSSGAPPVVVVTPGTGGISRFGGPADVPGVGSFPGSPWDAPPPPAVDDPPVARMSGRWALALAAGAVGIGALFQGAVYLLLRDATVAPADLTRYLIVGLLGFYLVVGLVVAAPLLRSTRLRWGDGDRVVAAVLGVTIGGGLAALLLGLQRLIEGQVTSDQNAVLMMSEGTFAHVAATFLIVVVAAPLVEEVLFRGLLLEALRRHGPQLAVLVSAAAFSAWHLNLSAWRYYLLAGLILGSLYVKRGLVASMAAHAAFNGTLVVVGLVMVLAPPTTVVDGTMSVPVPRGWTENGSTPRELRDLLENVPGFVALAGPSGSAAIFHADSSPGPGRILTADELAAWAQEADGAVLPGLGPVTSEGVGVVDLPVGQAVVLPYELEGQRTEIYLLSRPGTLYVVQFVDAGSAKARSDFRRILEGLQLT